MITLFRWLLIKQKKIKWELALWQFFDSQMKELIKNPDEVKKKFIDLYAAMLINSDRNNK